MTKRCLLIIFITLFLTATFFYWYFSYCLPKDRLKTRTKERTFLKEEENKNIKAIELEKPPFLKD